jgi:hypothetical protein
MYCSEHAGRRYFIGDLNCGFFCYPEEGESLEVESAKLENVCVVQSMKEETKKIDHVDSYMNACKCEEKNDDTNCNPEKVVETLVKITGVDWTPLCFVHEYDHLWNMPTLYCLFMPMKNYLLYIHMDLHCNPDWQPCVHSQYEF